MRQKHLAVGLSVLPYRYYSHTIFTADSVTADGGSGTGEPGELKQVDALKREHVERFVSSVDLPTVKKSHDDKVHGSLAKTLPAIFRLRRLCACT